MIGDLLEGLNDSLSIDELMRVPESQGLAEQDARLARLRGEPGSQERSIEVPDDGDIMGPRTPLKAFRQNYLDELERNPAVHQKLLALTQAEVGNQGPEAQQAFIESVFNRAASRKQSLNEAMQTVDQGGYYPGLGDISKVSPTTAANYDDLIKQVGTGSNVGNYATGNASGTVGFNKGPQVADFGGERFGIEGPDLRTMRGIAGGEIDPTAFTVPDATSTGRRKMADQPRGIMDLLMGTGQSPQAQPQGGLLGMLGDPETMSYLAMMLKGASPYSNLDPNAMLSNAHTIAMRKAALLQQQAEHAIDNRRADERLGLDRERFGLTKREYEAQQAQVERERQARENLYKGLGEGRPPEVTPDAATVPTEPLSEPDKIRAQIKYFEDRMGTLGQKDQIQAQKQIDLLNKRLTPTGTEQKLYDTASGNLPQLQSLKADLERAKELVPQAASNSVTSFFDKLASNLGETIAGPQAMATAELDRRMKATALTELRKLLPGPASNKDVAIINEIAASPGMSPTEKASRIGGVLQRVEAQIAKDKETIKRFRQKEGTYKPEDDEGSGGSLPGGWTVRVK